MTGSHREITTPAQLRDLMGESFLFSDAQFAAITAPLEPAVIVAGAGSGKTAVMAARVVWLVATGQVTPDEVLGLTFTTKAAGELATRIRTALTRVGILRPVDRRLLEGEEEVLEPTVSTYNSYAAALLTEHGLRIGHEPDTRVVADASRFQLAARAIARHTAPVHHLSYHLPTAIGSLLDLDGQLSEHLVEPEELRAFHARELPLWQAGEPGPKGGRKAIDGVATAILAREELLGLVEDYRALKARLGLMDFADQIAGGARLARQCPEVGTAERAKFKVVLLDEYQDTSVAQAVMLRALFSGATPETGRGHAVMAVGDPNQAIYGWRGASVSNILGFGHDFPPASAAGPTHVYSLAVNRRSDVRILEAANDLAAPLYALTAGSEPLIPKPEAAPGTVRTALLVTYADELEFLAREVRAAHAAMPEPAWSEIGVLTRDNSHAAAVYDALTTAEIPVEIVGLNGLLRLPEVAEVVATLQLLHDLTANASLLSLLAGPRWAVGARDLALLGRRARRLADGPGGRDSDTTQTIEQELASAVAGSDPADIVSLGEALDDPGPLEYSPEARERFALLSAELRYLRGFVGEPLVDLVRRIIDTTGIDLELASAVSETAQARRENLDVFVKAVADFQGLDGEVSLPALLAYLSAEDELGNGLDAATPSAVNSVKLLTVHRAKGLEWDVVFLPGVCATKFPTTKGRTSWLSGPAVLPSPLRGDAADLPQVTGHSEAAIKAHAEDVKWHSQVEELRLGYVAFTRARHTMVLSGHWWKPERKGALGPSPYLQQAADLLRSHGVEPDAWAEEPADDAKNPVLTDTTSYAWPVEANPAEVARRRAAAAMVDAWIADPTSTRGTAEPLSVEDSARVDAWDQELDRLLQEALESRADVVEVPLPSSLSATSLARLRDEPDLLAADLARPMPRKPSPSARFGTRFHAWVEASFGQQQIVDPDDLPGREDADIDDDSDLRELIDRFKAGAFADRVPAAVEPPFALVLDGQVVRGRIDAVYADGDGFLVVDWKTNRRQTADPLQLAIYRVAWAELRGVPVKQVRAAFYYVRTGQLVEPPDLPGRAGLEALVSRTGATSAT